MPTVLSDRGYRVFFYMGDSGEPPHVHVFKAGCEAKFWLQPRRLARNSGFKRAEIREIEGILLTHQKLILETWNEYFG